MGPWSPEQHAKYAATVAKKKQEGAIGKKKRKAKAKAKAKAKVKKVAKPNGASFPLEAIPDRGKKMTVRSNLELELVLEMTKLVRQVLGTK